MLAQISRNQSELGSEGENQFGPALLVTGTRCRSIPLVHVIFGRGEFWDPAPAARTKILPLELFVPLAQNINNGVVRSPRRLLCVGGF